MSTWANFDYMQDYEISSSHVNITNHFSTSQFDVTCSMHFL